MPLVDLNRSGDAVTWLFARCGLLCWPRRLLCWSGRLLGRLHAGQGWQCAGRLLDRLHAGQGGRAPAIGGRLCPGKPGGLQRTGPGRPGLHPPGTENQKGRRLRIHRPWVALQQLRQRVQRPWRRELREAGLLPCLAAGKGESGWPGQQRRVGRRRVSLPSATGRLALEKEPRSLVCEKEDRRPVDTT